MLAEILEGVDGVLIQHVFPLALQRAFPADLLLQLQEAVHESLSGGRTARNIDVDRDDPVTAANDAVAVMIIAAAIRL